PCVSPPQSSCAVPTLFNFEHPGKSVYAVTKQPTIEPPGSSRISQCRHVLERSLSLPLRTRMVIGGRQLRGKCCMTRPHPIVFLVDVDNTLVDNDGIQQDLKDHLEQTYGVAARDRYWTI